MQEATPGLVEHFSLDLAVSRTNIYICTRVKVCVCCVCMRVYAVVSSLHPFLCECRGIHTVHYGVLSLYMVVQGLTIVPSR